MYSFYYSLGFFGLLEFLGDWYPGLIANGLCYPLLGCNNGFFGYDAFMHLVSGICIGFGLLWFGRRKFLSFVTWSLGIAVGWELLEGSYDTYRRVVLHMDLLHPTNIMTQPTWIDTFGDITFGCAGTLLIFALFLAHQHHKHTRPQS